MKFYKDDELILELNTSLVEGKLPSPIKEIVSRERYFDYSVSINDNDIISLRDVIVFQLSIKGLSTLAAIYKKDEFPRNELIRKIHELKDSENYNEASVLDLFKSYSPLFYIYTYKEENTLGTVDAPIFVYKQIEKTAEEVNVEDSQPKVEEEKKENQFVKDMKIIVKNKYHFIFIVVSTFLFSFAASVGYCNVVIGKNIAALFFICAFVGVFLNTFVYKDYFEVKSIKDRLFPYSLVFNFVGIGLGVAATSLYHSFDKSGVKEAVTTKSLVLINLLMCVIMVTVTVAFAFLLNYLFKKFGWFQKKEEPAKENKQEKPIQEEQKEENENKAEQ